MWVTNGLLVALVLVSLTRLVLGYRHEVRYQRLLDALSPLWGGVLNQFRTMGASVTGEPDPTQISIGLGETGEHGVLLMEPTERDEPRGLDCQRWDAVYSRAHAIARAQYPGYRPPVWARVARQALADYLQSENAIGWNDN